MHFITPGKARHIMAFLLIGLAIGAGFTCQIHTSALDHGHTTSSTSHPTTSTHALLDFSCIGMVAIVPITILFVMLFLSMAPGMPRALKYTVLAFPPFVPPRLTMYSMQSV